MVTAKLSEIESKTGIRISEAAFLALNAGCTAVQTFGGWFDAEEVYRRMQNWFEVGEFAEGTPELALNLLKLGTAKNVRTKIDISAGTVLAMLGPHACLPFEIATADVAPASFHMETEIRFGHLVVWAPLKADDVRNIGSWVTDCHTFDCATTESFVANIDYHTAIAEFDGMRIPIPVIVSNTNIPAGSLLVGDFGDSFFLQPKYMVPNAKALVAHETSRKRKRNEDNAEDNKRHKGLIDELDTVKAHCTSFKARNEDLAKKVLNGQVAVAQLTAELRKAESDVKELYERNVSLQTAYNMLYYNQQAIQQPSAGW